MNEVKWIYNGEIFNTRREIYEKYKFSGSVIRAKIRDNEIEKIFIHTGTPTYEKENNWKNCRDIKS